MIRNIKKLLASSIQWHHKRAKNRRSRNLFLIPRAAANSANALNQNWHKRVKKIGRSRKPENSLSVFRERLWIHRFPRPLSEFALGIFRFTRGDLVAQWTNSESADYHSFVRFCRSRKRENSESDRGRRGHVLLELAEFPFRSCTKIPRAPIFLLVCEAINSSRPPWRESALAVISRPRRSTASVTWTGAWGRGSSGAWSSRRSSRRPDTGSRAVTPSGRKTPWSVRKRGLKVDELMEHWRSKVPLAFTFSYFSGNS